VLIDIVIPADRNVKQKGVDKKLNYRSLRIEGDKRRAWNMKCVIIPVISGVTGLVTEGSKSDLEAIAADRSIDPLQQTAVLGT
jgi:hypothetical protein